jgi:SAM-dependent methyltransferase
MLSVLRENAGNEGVANIETELADAHSLQFADEAFDRVTSRFGIMFFVEVQKALSEIKRVLKPGGKAAFLVWGPPSPDTFFGAAAMPFIKRLGIPPDPDAPTPMRFAEQGKLRREVEGAGFKDVTETVMSLPSRLPLDPQGVLSFLMEIAAPIRNAAANLPEEIRKEAEAEALANLASMFDGKGVMTNAPVIVVTGTK